eukprot:1715117-Pleurochrysis_carterae.AAC.1
MAAVRAMALVCESALWMLLRAIGSDAHILDVLPTIWPTAASRPLRAGCCLACGCDRRNARAH